MRIVAAPLVALILFGVIAVAQWLYYVPRLPSPVAVHMGPSGVDRWQDKEQFVASTPLGLAIPAAIFTGIAAISVLAILFLPDEFINLPNREYWLATRGRRIEAAMLVLNFWLWILAGGLGVAIGILQAMFQATFTGRDQIALPVVAGFVVFLIARIAVLIIRLRRGRDVEAAHPKRRA